MNRRRFLSGLAVVGLAVPAVITTSGAAPRGRPVQVSRYTVPLGSGPIRIVQLSDLHLGRATPAALVEQALAAAHGARPDLTVLTGDYLNHSLHYLPRLDDLARRLPRPCVAVLGNHDHWAGAEVIQKTLERHGIQVLRNSRVRLQLPGGELQVIGVDDGRHGDLDRAFAGTPDPGRALVLSHHPKTAAAIVARGARLVLCGHTHGGQIAIPRITASLARLGGHRYLSGWYRLDGARVYVSPGLGASLIRLRLGRKAAAEVAVFDLI